MTTLKQLAKGKVFAASVILVTDTYSNNVRFIY